MLRGYAIMVQHPRRHDQDFVTCDVEYAAKEIHTAVVDCKWPVNVSLISFAGQDALQILFSLWELKEKAEQLFPGFGSRFDVVTDKMACVK